MGILKRNRNQEIPNNTDPITPPAARAARLILEQEQGGPSEQIPDFEMVLPSLFEHAEKNRLAWADFTLFCDGINYQELVSEASRQEAESQPRPGMILGRNKVNPKAHDIKNLVIVSARIQGLASKGGLDWDISPAIYTPPGSHPNSVIQMANTKIHNDAVRLLGSSGEIAWSQSQAVRIITEQIDLVGVDPVIEWLRTAGIETGSTATQLLRMLAQDTIDAKNSKIIESIQREGEQDTTRAIKEFAVTIEQTDDPNDQIKSWLQFVQEYVDPGVDLADILSRVPVEIWPPQLRQAFSQYGSNKRNDCIGELQAILRPHYVHNHRDPNLDDLRQLEENFFSIGQEVNSRQKRIRTVQDYSPARSNLEVPAPEPRLILSGRIAVINGKKTVVLPERGEEVVVESDIMVVGALEAMKLVGRDRAEMEIDIKKMLKSLQNTQTVNRGITTISEVPRLLLDGKQVAVKRMNPAFFTGLSVGKRGKDMWVLYCDGADRAVVVLGIFPHDRYDSVIEGLR